MHLRPLRHLQVVVKQAVLGCVQQDAIQDVQVAQVAQGVVPEVVAVVALGVPDVGICVLMIVVAVVKDTVLRSVVVPVLGVLVVATQVAMVVVREVAIHRVHQPVWVVQLMQLGNEVN